MTSDAPDWLMLGNPSEVGVWAYGLATAGFLLFGGYLFLGWRNQGAGRGLLVAVLASAAWSAASGIYSSSASFAVGLVCMLLDVLRQGAWLAFVIALLRRGGAGQSWPLWVAGGIGALQVSAIAVFAVGPAWGSGSGAIGLGAFLAGGVAGLVLIEHFFRCLPLESRWAFKPFCLGLAAGYVFEIYLFADGLLFGRVDSDVWGVRGAVSGLTIPLIALAVGRNPGWTCRIGVSRELIFHSTALALSGLYLLLIAGAGYYVRYFGGEWGRAIQFALIFGGLLLLLVFAFSGTQRARLRVFLSKHLFPYRYDYRLEWLRFTQALGTMRGEELGTAVVSALADLVESAGGGLWLRGSDGGYTQRSRVNQLAVDAVEPSDGEFCAFLREREWIVNLEEYRASPAHYGGLGLPEWLSALPGAWLILPMKSDDSLVGFVVLNAPRTPFEVDWEVLDLLKTAQRQAASYLSRILATEALLESRKFESFNRMSAFVVHDLKNLVAQLSLMLKNAERHGGNPEFQADMITTVAHVEARMRALMSQLQEKQPFDPPRRVDVRALIDGVIRSLRATRPSCEFRVAVPDRLDVLAHPERLERILSHLAQNAVEATSGSDTVVLSAERGRDGRVGVVIEDHGCGMTKEFMRERLFRPFQTSKAAGMGIGVYEAQQYVRELGGDIAYDSEPGRGTRVLVTLPAAVSHAAGGPPERVLAAS